MHFHDQISLFIPKKFYYAENGNDFAGTWAANLDSLTIAQPVLPVILVLTLQYSIHRYLLCQYTVGFYFSWTLSIILKKRKKLKLKSQKENAIQLIWMTLTGKTIERISTVFLFSMNPATWGPYSQFLLSVILSGSMSLIRSYYVILYCRTRCGE